MYVVVKKGNYIQSVVGVARLPETYRGIAALCASQEKDNYHDFVVYELIEGVAGDGQEVERLCWRKGDSERRWRSPGEDDLSPFNPRPTI